MTFGSGSFGNAEVTASTMSRRTPLNGSDGVPVVSASRRSWSEIGYWGGRGTKKFGARGVGSAGADRSVGVVTQVTCPQTARVVL